MIIRPMIEYIKENLNGKPLIGVEIGVRHGSHSRTIMEYLNIKKLYSIDPYVSYVDADGVAWNRKFKFMNKTLRSAKHILSPYIEQGKCEFIIDYSSKACNVVPDSLDFVYIDGCHKYDFVFEDCTLWVKKVKKNGVFGGHDYTSKYDDVRFAVDDFCKQYNLVLHTRYPDWWIVK